MILNPINTLYMITQNPVIGHSHNKIGNVYGRTLYGKNVLQTCPPPTKGKQTASQVAVCSMFGRISKLSNQIDASLLNQIYYYSPLGRSRRGQWCKDLATGMQKVNNVWSFNPLQIQQLGTNTAVSSVAFPCVVGSSSLRIAIADLSALAAADTTEIPLLILICPSKDICISLLPFTSLDGDDLVLSNLSSTLFGEQSYIFPLWQTNIGTTNTPIYAYGAFEKID